MTAVLVLVAIGVVWGVVPDPHESHPGSDAGGGCLYERWGATGIVILDASLLVTWLAAALGTWVADGQRQA